MGNYDASISIPIGGQPISSGGYGVPVRNAILNLDSRLSIREAAEMMPPNVSALGNGQNVITSSSGVWANMPTFPVSVQITNPSTIFTMVCQVFFGAWMQAGGAANIQYGLNVTGGVTSDPEPGANSPVGYGMLPLTNATAATQCMGYFTLLIPAGAATVTLTGQAKRTGTLTGTFNVNYPSIEVMPVRFQ